MVNLVSEGLENFLRYRGSIQPNLAAFVMDNPNVSNGLLLKQYFVHGDRCLKPLVPTRVVGDI